MVTTAKANASIPCQGHFRVAFMLCRTPHERTIFPEMIIVEYRPFTGRFGRGGIVLAAMTFFLTLVKVDGKLFTLCQ